MTSTPSDIPEKRHSSRLEISLGPCSLSGLRALGPGVLATGGIVPYVHD